MRRWTKSARNRIFVLVMAWLAAVGACAHAAAAGDPAFDQWVQSLWPEAQKLGVSRATFDMATRGLEPDLTLPDLVIPGRPEAPQRGQAEFVLTPTDYLKEATIARLAAQGRDLLAKHRATLERIERQFGVPPSVVLAIWGRESAYGSGAQRDGRNAIRVLATQAYLGRRKEQFRQEFLTALKLLQEGHMKVSEMRSSWAGAMGMTQFLPSEFYKHGVDFDGDGRIDIFSSVPDALASAAKQLVNKGWQPGKRWAYEVRPPKNFDCTIAEPAVTMPIADWLTRGFVPAYGRKLSADELAETTSLLMPEGSYGPAFLTPKNYYVIKDYNFSDLYVLFVGHLSDRILESRPFETAWSKTAQLRTVDVEAMQRGLTELGFYRDKIDGKAGMLTRSALGAYQKANGLKLDCWPTSSVVDHIRARIGSR
jgi:lytic murein transglycosylase